MVGEMKMCGEPSALASAAQHSPTLRFFSLFARVEGQPTEMWMVGGRG
jgi:hypothetical protein